MKVEIKEVAVFTKDNGEEVLVWDRAFINEIRSLSVILPPVRGKRTKRPHKPNTEPGIKLNQERPAVPDNPTRRSRGRPPKAPEGSSADLQEVRELATAAGLGRAE